MPAFPKPTATETDPVASPTAAAAGVAAAAAQSTADSAASAASAAQSTADSAVTAAGLKLAKASNLSDLASAATARTNLGLGSAATTAASAYATSAQGATADSALALAATKALPTKAWVTATAYLQGQMVTNSGHTYTANDAHTSGATFAGDLAGHWTPLPVTASDVGAIASTIVDAKGDLIVATADNTVARVAVGANGKALVGASGATPGVAWADVTQWRQDIFPMNGGEAVATNWPQAITQDGLYPYGAYRQSSGAQNAQIAWDVLLGEGTWTISLLHTKFTNQGIYTVSLDSTSVGTIDAYAASVSRGALSALTGVAVASTGVKRLAFTMATKNASSSSYFGIILAVNLQRTA